MSFSRHTMHHLPADGSEKDRAADLWSAPRLHHELANLLDGSLRHLSLAIRELSGQATSGPLPKTGSGASPGAIPGAIPGGGDAVERLELVRRGLERMTRLLPDERRRADADSHQETLAEVVGQLERWVRPLAQAQGVCVRAEIESDVADHPGGPLEPILRNALRNSLEAMSDAAGLADRVMTIRGRGVGDRLEIVIDDTGPGFDPLLFDEGGAFRFGVSTRGPARGRGLSLSSDLARTLGGSIAVGRAPDGGGRVVIDLPRSPRSPRTPRSPGKLGELEERRSA